MAPNTALKTLFGAGCRESLIKKGERSMEYVYVIHYVNEPTCDVCKDAVTAVAKGMRYLQTVKDVFSDSEWKKVQKEFNDSVSENGGEFYIENVMDCEKAELWRQEDLI